MLRTVLELRGISRFKRKPNLLFYIQDIYRKGSLNPPQILVLISYMGNALNNYSVELYNNTLLFN